MSEETQDVVATPATGADPSVSEVATGSETQRTEAPAQPANKGEFIPRTRLNEEIEKRRQLEAEVARYKQTQTPQPQANAYEDRVQQELKKHLETLGYVSREEIQRMEAQKEADRALQSEAERLTKEWNGDGGKPKYDHESVVNYAYEHGIASLEAAFKLMNEKAYLDWHANQVLANTRGTRMERSDGSGAANVQLSDDDVSDGLAKGDPGAKKLFLKRLSSKYLNKGGS